jgi:hypothetical protein
MVDDLADEPTSILKAERTAPAPPVVSIFSTSEPANPTVLSDFLEQVQSVDHTVLYELCQ